MISIGWFDVFNCLWLITAWCVALYIKTINYGLVVDDVKMYDPARNQLGNTIASRLYGACTVNNIKIDRLISIGLHWIMSCLVAIFITPLAGVLFAVHPTTMQVSTWLNGKRFAINGILTMMMFASPLAFVLYPIVFMFQPSAIPSILLSFKHMNGMFLIPVALALLPFTYKRIITRFKSRSKQTDGHEVQRFNPKKLIFCVKSLWVYFRQSVLPEKNVMYYEDYYGITIDETPIYKLDYRFWFGLAALAFVAFHFKQGWWFWLLFVFQWLNLVTYTQLFADRYVYIALVGACWYLSGTIFAIPLIGFYVARSLDNTRQYVGLEEFFKYNNEIAPKNAQSAIFLSGQYIQNPYLIHDAISTLRVALLNNPYSCLVNYQMAVCLEQVKDYNGAYNFYNNAIKLLGNNKKEQRDIIVARANDVYNKIKKDNYEKTR